MLKNVLKALTQKGNSRGALKAAGKFLNKIQRAYPDLSGLVDALKKLLDDLLQRKRRRLGDFKRKVGKLFNRLRHRGMVLYIYI